MSTVRRRIAIAVFLLAAPLTAHELAVQRVDAIGAEPVVSDYDVPPKLLKQKKPKYPKDAFKQKIQGVVRLEFIIETNGEVRDVRVLDSIPALDEAAIRTLRSWRFAPARQKGVPVRVVAQAPVAFCIDRPCAPPAR
jgi:TonB family protein